MVKSIYVDESNMVAATHRVQRKVQDLVAAADEYLRLLSDLNGIINDGLITLALSELAGSVKQTVSTLEGMDGALGAVLSRYHSELESVNDLRYPDSVLTQVREILSAFL